MAKAKRYLSDILVVIGLAILVGTTATIDWRAALYLAGLACVIFGVLVALARRSGS